MSKSFKKVPIFGNASTSDKESKRQANRKERTIVRQLLNELENDACTDSSLIEENWDELNIPIKREISNVWDFAKDGKNYKKNYKEKDLRK